MKKLLLLPFIVFTLMSCAESRTVKVLNGAMVEAENVSDTRYVIGSHVCITNSGRHGTFQITTSGEMMDTMYVDRRNKSRIIYKTGVIQDFN